MGAAIFVSRQVAHLKRSREMDGFLRVIDAGNREPVCSAANWIKYHMDGSLSYKDARNDPEIWAKISAIEHHFEMIGILVQNGYLSANLVYDQMGLWIAGTWAKLESLIATHRGTTHAPDYAENF